MRNISDNQLSIFSLQEPPASPSVSPDSGADFQRQAETWPLNFVEYLQSSGQNGFCGRTSPVFFQLTVAGPSGPSFEGFESAGIVAHGGCWTLSFSEYPSVAVGSSLSDILETTGDHLQRYYLSPKACAGIIRRAGNRGRMLPEPLADALAAVASALRKPPETK